jgi:hypothetical protein
VWAGVLLLWYREAASAGGLLMQLTFDCAAYCAQQQGR